MSTTETGQVSRTGAEVYEEFYVPALFGEWAQRLAAAAGVHPGESVLDVACGTGIMARAIAGKSGARVVGMDVNRDMLEVARRRAPALEWRQGRAESLPYASESFDVVVCQFGLMFFEDRRAAVREMARVLRPGGRLIVTVWDRLENTPGYAAMVDLLQRLFGGEVAGTMRAPYALGDSRLLTSLFAAADFESVRVSTRVGFARFPSVRAWVHTDVKGWTIADMIDDAGLQLLLDEAERELRRFAGSAGEVVFSAPAHIVTALKPDAAR